MVVGRARGPGDASVRQPLASSSTRDTSCSPRAGARPPGRRGRAPSARSGSDTRPSFPSARSERISSPPRRKVGVPSGLQAIPRTYRGRARKGGFPWLPAPTVTRRQRSRRSPIGDKRLAERELVAGRPGEAARPSGRMRLEIGEGRLWSRQPSSAYTIRTPTGTRSVRIGASTSVGSAGSAAIDSTSSGSSRRRPLRLLLASESAPMAGRGGDGPD